MNKFLKVISGIFDKFARKADGVLTAVQGVAWMRYFKIFACGTLLVLSTFYAAATLFYNEGGFSVALRDNKGRLDKSGQLSLSETEGFENPTVQLKANSAGELTCVSGADLPDNIDDPESNGIKDNFIIYTFYAKNSGNAACNVRATMNIEDVVRNVDDAVRIRLYKDGVHTTYAKLAADGTPEYGTSPFWDEETVFTDVTEDFAAGDIIKYTVVIWLEGDDPECLDNIRGGNLKMSLTLSVEEDAT